MVYKKFSQYIFIFFIIKQKFTMSQLIDISQYGRIVLQFDGNNNDLDDVSALPIAGLITEAAGLQNKTTFFYKNNLSEKSIPLQVDKMRNSAAFVEKLGISTYDYLNSATLATNELVKILNLGEKVLITAGGPMETVYRALEQTDPKNLANITLLSHSKWNENRDRITESEVTEARKS